MDVDGIWILLNGFFCVFVILLLIKKRKICFLKDILDILRLFFIILIWILQNIF